MDSRPPGTRKRRFADSSDIRSKSKEKPSA